MSGNSRAKCKLGAIPSLFSFLQVTATHQLATALSTLSLSVRPWLLACSSPAASPEGHLGSATLLQDEPTATAQQAATMEWEIAENLSGTAGGSGDSKGFKKQSSWLAGAAAAGIPGGVAEERWQAFLSRGSAVLSEALLLSLPGLDANDPPKTLATLQLYFATFSCVSEFKTY